MLITLTAICVTLDFSVFGEVLVGPCVLSRVMVSAVSMVVAVFNVARCDG